MSLPHPVIINSLYKFLTDMNGNTFAHSLLYPRPVTLKENFNPVDIRLLETTKGFEVVWETIRSHEGSSPQVLKG
jgi:hypothetical protein